MTNCERLPTATTHAARNWQTNLTRSETLQRHRGSELGTSCESSSVTNPCRSPTTRPSKQNVCHQKNPASSRGSFSCTVKTRAAARIQCLSAPSHYQPARQRPSGCFQPDKHRRASGTNG